MLKDFTEEELNNLITNKVEENIHLDYKGAGALSKQEQKRMEISKDVSAFANSDGGLIVYGIQEFSGHKLKHFPEKIDPISRSEISKEWLEQVINTNIQPKIKDLRIHPISINSSNNDVVYVVNIPKSITAHQAKDKKYYKRYNFESVAMDDYEIKDIISRSSSPDLVLILDPENLTYSDNILSFSFSLGNNSIKLARDVMMTIEFKNFENYDVLLQNRFSDSSNLNRTKKIFSLSNKIEIYNGLNAFVGSFQLKLKENVSKVEIESRLYCDNMSLIKDKFEILINSDGSPEYNLLS